MAASAASASTRSGSAKCSRIHWIARLIRASAVVGVAMSRSGAVHVGFVANSAAEVDAAYGAAMAIGAVDNGAPGARLHYDPRYYAANGFDPVGYSLEFLFKSWQHAQ